MLALQTLMIDIPDFNQEEINNQNTDPIEINIPKPVSRRVNKSIVDQKKESEILFLDLQQPVRKKLKFKGGITLEFKNNKYIATLEPKEVELPKIKGIRRKLNFNGEHFVEQKTPRT